MPVGINWLESTRERVIFNVVRRVNSSVARFLIYAIGHKLVRVEYAASPLAKGNLQILPAGIFSGQGKSS